MTHEQEQALNAWLHARDDFHASGGYANPNTRGYKQLQQAVFNATLRCQAAGVTSRQMEAARQQHEMEAVR